MKCLWTYERCWPLFSFQFSFLFSSIQPITSQTFTTPTIPKALEVCPRKHMMILMEIQVTSWVRCSTETPLIFWIFQETSWLGIANIEMKCLIRYWTDRLWGPTTAVWNWFKSGMDRHSPTSTWWSSCSCGVLGNQASFILWTNPPTTTTTSSFSSWLLRGFSRFGWRWFWLMHKWIVILDKRMMVAMVVLLEVVIVIVEMMMMMMFRGSALIQLYYGGNNTPFWCNAS